MGVQCELCGRWFKKELDLASHLRFTRMFGKCPALKKYVAPADPPWICEKCGKEFDSRGGLGIHMGLMSPEKKPSREPLTKKCPPWICGECGRPFDTRQGLGTHLGVSRKAGSCYEPDVLWMATWLEWESR